MNLIYAMDEKGKNELLVKGFNFIAEQNMNGKIMYLFENNNDNITTFCENDMKKFIFTNKMFI